MAAKGTQLTDSERADSIIRSWMGAMTASCRTFTESSGIVEPLRRVIVNELYRARVAAYQRLRKKTPGGG